MGNVYMEAEQVRFKNSSYHNLQTAVSAALEGGGGGGTTVVANPEGSATADLAKLQVGETIYGIPAEAGDISYDNTSSGMTADDVQEAIDELNTGLSGVSELIPSDATSSNKLATADDIPGAATTSAPGIVQPDGTTITIADGVISAVGGGGGSVISGTTNIERINWLRYGNVVVVTSNGASVSTSGTAITGLPLPYGGAYQVGACYNQSSMVANIIYDSNNGWRIVGTGSGSPSAFGSLAYIAADN